MKVSVAKIAGTPSKSAWSQVHTFTPEEEKQKTHGQLIAVLSVSQVPEEIEAVNLGKELLVRVHEEYFGNEEDSPFEALKKALKKVADEFLVAASFEIVALVIWQDYVYLAAAGEAKVALWREGKLTVILQGEKEKVSALSGKGREKDVFIFGSSAFFRAVSSPALRETLEKTTLPSEVVDNFAPLVHQTSNPSLAGAILKVGKTEAVSNQTQETASLPKERVRAARVKNFFARLAARLPEKEIVIAKGGGSRRTAVSVGIILLLLLLLSIGLGIRQKNIRDYRSSYEDELLRAQSLYENALVVKEADPTRAREDFLESKSLVEQLVVESIKDSRLEDLKKKIEQDTVSILGVVEVSPGTFLDLLLVRAEVRAEKMALDAGALVVFDRGGKRVISILVDNKNTEVFGAEDLEEASQVATYAGRHFVLTSKGVVELEKRGEPRTVVEKDEEWGKIAGLGAFGSNLYLLDQDGEIWRYPGIEGGFGSRQRWLGQGVEPDFSLAEDMAIDGSIWVLTRSGKIVKFTRGSPDAFSVRGLDKGLSEPRAIYTDENLESLFVLDSGNGRIVEIKKTGEYQKQYLWDRMGEVKDIAVSRDEGKLFLLTAEKILEVTLK